LSKKIASLRLFRAWPGSLAFVLASQISISAAAAQAVQTPRPDHYWRKFAVGFASSILAHETAHLLTAMAVGAHPYLGFDKGRPTVFSGIDSKAHPHMQFLFSASGLTAQALINEAILDIPHTKGGAIERGILAGGIATTAFYVTLGRNASVSDISFMARTSSLSKTQLSLIFGGVAALQAWRISRDSRYNHFFIRPDKNGLAAGISY
jgi:hypothetical protein